MAINDDRNKDKKFRITTAKGDVEINWSNDQRPGFCPHCHKCIPFSSIVFKKEHEGGTEVYSGLEAIMERKEAVVKRKFGISKEQNAGYSERIGECPYCHKPIPVREIIFKKAND
jgi:hypothetical protein